MVSKLEGRRAVQKSGIALEVDDVKTVADNAVLIGQITLYGGFVDPPNDRWLVCDGRVFGRTTYPELFAAIGTSFNIGGETATQFRIPDMRGRAPVGSGISPDPLLTDRGMGARFGSETHTLIVDEMPNHGHGGATGEADLTHNHGGTSGSTNLQHNHGGATGSVNLAHTHSDAVDGFSLTVFMGAIAAGTVRLLSNIAAVAGNTGSGLTTHSHSIPNALAGHSHSIPNALDKHAHGIDAQGGGQAHNNVQPSIGVNFVIRAKV